MNDDLINLTDFFFSFLFSHQNLQLDLYSIVGCHARISLLADRIKQQAGTAAQDILLEKLQPLDRVFYLDKMLQGKLDEFEVFF